MPVLRAMQGDITTLDCDAIVTAIHRAAGPELLLACGRIGSCPAGEPVITPGFNLKAHHVIHTVGPVWRGGG